MYRTPETTFLFTEYWELGLNVIKTQGAVEYGHSGRVRGTGGEGFLSACWAYPQDSNSNEGVGNDHNQEGGHGNDSREG